MAVALHQRLSAASNDYICATASKLGFPPPEPARSLNSIAHLFGQSRSRCGVYFLALDDGEFYIGQAIDVVRQFADHRRVSRDIVAFSFVPVSADKLDKHEKQALAAAATLNLSLRNFLQTHVLRSGCDLDSAVAPGEQRRLPADAQAINLKDAESYQALPFLWASGCDDFARFSSHGLSFDSAELLADYVLRCVPFAKRTEYTFWSLACMPPIERTTMPGLQRALACVNLGAMETLAIGHPLDDPAGFHAFLTVDAASIAARWPDEAALRRQFPGVTMLIDGCYHREPGWQQCQLRAADPASLRELLRDSVICKAACVLNMWLMRKRTTLYSRFHCKPLADHLYRLWDRRGLRLFTEAKETARPPVVGPEVAAMVLGETPARP